MFTNGSAVNRYRYPSSIRYIGSMANLDIKKILITQWPLINAKGRGQSIFYMAKFHSQNWGDWM